MKFRTCTIAASVLTTLVCSSVSATEIKSAWGHVGNLECSTPSSVVLEKARSEAFKTLGDYTQYQQINEWSEFDYYLNKDGTAIYAVEENLDQCVSHEGVASASFVEKKTMDEDWYVTYENWRDCGPHLDLSEEARWIRALESATEYAGYECANKAEPIFVERIAVTAQTGFDEPCYEIKARFKCVKS